MEDNPVILTNCVDCAHFRSRVNKKLGLLHEAYCGHSALDSGEGEMAIHGEPQSNDLVVPPYWCPLKQNPAANSPSRASQR